MNLHFGKRVVLLWRNDYGKGDECKVFCERKLINGLSRKLTWKHSLDLGILNITLRITENVRSVNGVGMAC